MAGRIGAQVNRIAGDGDRRSLHFLYLAQPKQGGSFIPARAQGAARFAQFVEQLGRHLQRGGSLVKAVHAEIRPEDAEFLDPSLPEDVP